jgi:8-amino-7-oxononanoate synthase
VPVIVGSADRAVALATQLAADGLFVPAIRPPSVPAGGSLVRASLACHHTDDDLDRLAVALSRSLA